MAETKDRLKLLQPESVQPKTSTDQGKRKRKAPASKKAAPDSVPANQIPAKKTSANQKPAMKVKETGSKRTSASDSQESNRLEFLFQYLY